MFCNQCEQTAKGTGCTILGVCGKNADVAARQDELVAGLRRLAAVALAARAAGVTDTAVDDFAFKALFSTLTNVNFDPADLTALQRACADQARALAAKAGLPLPPAGWQDFIAGLPLAVDAFSDNADVRSAMQILLYGLKGVAAYADHAAVLGQRDPDVAAFLYEGLVAGTALAARDYDLDGWVELLMSCGKTNLRAMELLEAGNTGHYGHPVPTPVSLGQRKGKAILVSGHDLADLEALLEQTAGTGINVYTHGEMLPAHGYPRLSAHPHLAGHYGTAWQNQQKELPAFPGAVLFTTNCIQDPRDYADKVFTSGNVGWPGLVHCTGRDFSAVIRKAKELPGFAEDVPGKTVLAGFGRETLLGAAPAVLDAVRAGKLRHIFLVGGCDGARPGRNYYTELVEKIPADCLILTLACGKFRFFDKDLGSIGDLPRLLDVGQCNDAYAAVRTAIALAEALGCGVNDLPLSLILSWYEQKAVSILLTLLALGVKNIRLGPTLPAFVSPAILNLLVENWGIAPISSPDEDLKAILG
ncbi:MAG TPA: hydroxylamine reductase [Candidatus Desulfovibrio intestinavium]|uniref:Hydroxylamine reductase n=1 Tax=Candidatus Desulfovibrio intestinavium TaxID=2838534 RepID=A0A9D2KR22_9BACT|nr:hydroxylamine reductase [Candidatus Desulfovibrio intestinavium]